LFGGSWSCQGKEPRESSWKVDRTNAKSYTWGREPFATVQAGDKLAEEHLAAKDWEVVPLDAGSKGSHQNLRLFKQQHNPWTEGGDMTPFARHTRNPASTFVPHSARKTSTNLSEVISRPSACFSFETKSIYLECLYIFHKIFHAMMKNELDKLYQSFCVLLS